MAKKGTVLFYRRDGRPIARAKVEEIKAKCADEYRRGSWLHKQNIGMAESIDRMTAERFCCWSGLFNYRTKEY